MKVCEYPHRHEFSKHSAAVQDWEVEHIRLGATGRDHLVVIVEPAHDGHRRCWMGWAYYNPADDKIPGCQYERRHGFGVALGRAIKSAVRQPHSPAFAVHGALEKRALYEAVKPEAIRRRHIPVARRLASAGQMELFD